MIVLELVLWLLRFVHGSGSGCKHPAVQDLGPAVLTLRFGVWVSRGSDV